MANEITEEVIRLAEKIHKLRTQAGEKWEPKEGDWYIWKYGASDGSDLLVLCHPDSPWTDMWRIAPDECFPIPTYSDLRQWLRKRRWALCRAYDLRMGEQAKIGDVFIEFEQYDTLYGFKRNQELVSTKAPTDRLAIMKVVLEVLKRELLRNLRSKEQADE